MVKVKSGRECVDLRAYAKGVLIWRSPRHRVTRTSLSSLRPLILCTTIASDQQWTPQCHWWLIMVLV